MTAEESPTQSQKRINIDIWQDERRSSSFKLGSISVLVEPKTGLKLNRINPSVLLPNGIQKGVPTAIIDDVVNVWQTNNLNCLNRSDKKKFRLFKSLSAVLGSSVKTILNFTT